MIIEIIFDDLQFIDEQSERLKVSKGRVNIQPHKGELPSIFSDRLGVDYTNGVTLQHKKESGQFFTPHAISNLMSSFSTTKSVNTRILDPGFGTGVLSCSLVEYLLKNNPKLNSIELIAYETDTALIEYSQKALKYLKGWVEKHNIQFKYTLRVKDFILDSASLLTKSKQREEFFDAIISNPPYFKLPKSDGRTLAAKEIVKGQTNIYSIFMGIAATLLAKKGELIFITPRSFASGSYFKTFREHFFGKVQLERIHLFVSRRDTFNRDSVLQETVIIKAVNGFTKVNHVVISSSNGLKDIIKPSIKRFPQSELIDLNSNEKILHLPINEREERVLDLVSAWNNKLKDLNIQISTGPVVSFRALSHIYDNYENGKVFLAPLFWLHNVNKMHIIYPAFAKNKGQYIRIDAGSKSILIPNKDYILLRRFSTKDDKSRLIAAPYFSEFTKTEFIGVENKVNYIYRVKGQLKRFEVIGLCALLNSDLFNTYFQIFNGNVNVSATELREMNFPSIEVIEEIGKTIIKSKDYSMENINQITNELFELEAILN